MLECSLAKVTVPSINELWPSKLTVNKYILSKVYEFSFWIARKTSMSNIKFKMKKYQRLQWSFTLLLSGISPFQQVEVYLNGIFIIVRSWCGLKPIQITADDWSVDFFQVDCLNYQSAAKNLTVAGLAVACHDVVCHHHLAFIDDIYWPDNSPRH